MKDLSSETPESTASKAHEIDLLNFTLELAKRTHATTALVISSRLEQALMWILEGHMPNLSNRLGERLFEGYGPLGSFSAKIDLAFALGFISKDDRQRLHAVRSIRNEFAHSRDGKLDFESKKMANLVAALPKPKQLYTSNLHLFLRATEECADALQAILDRLGLARAVREYVEKPKTLRKEPEEV